jgi:flagellin
MTSINSNIAAFSAQNNLRAAQDSTSRSIASLSSGNRIIRASDDVAGLAIGTVLRSNVSTLKTALNSANQGATLLAIADGALQNIGELLQRQKALAVSANSGTLTDLERGFLNQEFQALTDQINQTAGNTKFNSVNLLDGSIFDISEVNTNTTTAGAQASVSLTIDGTVTAGDSIILTDADGEQRQITFSAGGSGSGNVDLGGTTAASGAAQTALLNFLQNSSDDFYAQFEFGSAFDGNEALTIQANNAGTAGNAFTIQTLAADGAAAAANIDLNAANGATAINLSGGTNGDLNDATNGDGRVSFSATSNSTGDSILNSTLTAGGPVAASIQVDLDTIVAGESLTVDGVAFTFGTGPGQLALVGTDAEDAVTLATAINEQLDNVRAVVSGTGANDLTLYATDPGTAGNAIGTVGAGGVTPVGVTLAGGVDSAVGVSDVTNADFVGTISGFEATFLSANSVSTEVTVGNSTYSATIADTSAAQTVRYSSDDGGFFDVQITGTSVTNQDGANTFAARLDAGFSTITFEQTRDVSSSSYAGVGDVFTGSTRTSTLSDSSVDLTFNDFSKAEIASVEVIAQQAGQTTGTVRITLANGDVYENTSITNSVVAQAGTLTLTSTSNANETIVFTLGNIDADGGGNALNFNTDDRAASLQAAIEGAFGIGEGGGGLDFQVGIAATDTIKVAIQEVSTTKLFRDSTGILKDLDISSAAGAIEASAILDNAIQTVTSVRSNVGALQSRFNFVGSTLESAIQNTDAARSSFLDADISEEATAFATSQVLVQASISVLAQANQLPQNLLKLIG